MEGEIEVLNELLSIFSEMMEKLEDEDEDESR